MSKGDKYFVIPEPLKVVFLELDDKDAGLLITALSDYHFHGQKPNGLSARLAGMFSVLKIVTHKDFKL